jgi:hypothetical protein
MNLLTKFEMKCQHYLGKMKMTKFTKNKGIPVKTGENNYLTLNI